MDKQESLFDTIEQLRLINYQMGIMSVVLEWATRNKRVDTIKHGESFVASISTEKDILLKGFGLN